MEELIEEKPETLVDRASRELDSVKSLWRASKARLALLITICVFAGAASVVYLLRTTTKVVVETSSPPSASVSSSSVASQGSTKVKAGVQATTGDCSPVMNSVSVSGNLSVTCGK